MPDELKPEPVPPVEDSEPEQDELFDCPLHGKLGDTDECAKCGSTTSFDRALSRAEERSDGT